MVTVLYSYVTVSFAGSDLSPPPFTAMTPWWCFSSGLAVESVNVIIARGVTGVSPKVIPWNSGRPYFASGFSGNLASSNPPRCMMKPSSPLSKSAAAFQVSSMPRAVTVPARFVGRRRAVLDLPAADVLAPEPGESLIGQPDHLSRVTFANLRCRQRVGAEQRSWPRLSHVDTTRAMRVSEMLQEALKLG